jgi:hypothetical protein
MHPFGMYLALRDSQRKSRSPYARVDALPLLEPEPASRRERLAAAFRRLLTREHHDLAGDQAPRLLPR